MSCLLNIMQQLTVACYRCFRRPSVSY